MKAEKKDPPVFLVGSNICFKVNKQQAGSEEISYNVEKPDGTFVPLVTELNDSDKTTVKATYTPDVIGMHSLKMYSSGKEISTSPVLFMVEPDLVDTSEKLASPSDFKPTSFSPNFCECDVLKMEKKNPPTFVVGSNVCFEVNKRQVGGEKVSYKVEKPDGTPMMLPIEQADSDHPTVKATYIPEVIGMHSVRVYSSNNEIPESPLPFEVKPARNQLYGKSISLNLDLVGTSEEELTCRFIEKDSKLQYKGKISKIGKDKYNFSFFPKDVGLYSLYIKDRGIKRGPIIIRYGQPASPSNLEPIVDSPTFSVCDVMKVEKKDPPVFLVGSNICFEVNKQQAGSEEISYNVEKPDGTFVPLVTELNDSDKTTVKATYTPDVIGMHSLKVYSSGKEIPTSPLPFKVEPAPVQPIGKPISLNLDLADTSEKDLNCYFIHKDSNISYEGKVAKIGRDRYNFSFSPKDSGPYSLYINDNGIKKGPIDIYYGQPASPSDVRHASYSPTFGECDVLKIKKEDPPTFVVGSNVSFEVNKMQAGGEQISYKLEKPDGTPLMLVTEQADSDEPTVKATYIPEVIGMHSMRVYSSGKEILESPLPFKVKPAPVQPLGKPISLNFDLAGTSEKDLKCHFIHKETNIQYKAKIAKIARDKYNMSFSPTVSPSLPKSLVSTLSLSMTRVLKRAQSSLAMVRPLLWTPNTPDVIGMHSLKMYASGKEIPTSPLPFKVEPAPDQSIGKPISLNLDMVGASEKLASQSDIKPANYSPTFCECDVLKIEREDPPTYVVGSNVCF